MNKPIKLRGRELKFPPLPPTVKAELDIKNLASDPELTPIIILGKGILSEEQIAENKRRRDIKTEKILSIIKEHGVVPEYVEKSEQVISQLQGKIAEMRTTIAEERAWIKKLKS